MHCMDSPVAKICRSETRMESAARAGQSSASVFPQRSSAARPQYAGQAWLTKRYRPSEPLMKATAGKFAMKASKRCSARRAREECSSAARRMCMECRQCHMGKDTKTMLPAAKSLSEQTAVSRQANPIRQTAAAPSPDSPEPKRYRPRPFCDKVTLTHSIGPIADFSRTGPPPGVTHMKFRMFLTDSIS